MDKTIEIIIKRNRGMYMLDFTKREKKNDLAVDNPYRVGFNQSSVSWQLNKCKNILILKKIKAATWKKISTPDLDNFK